MGKHLELFISVPVNDGSCTTSCFVRQRKLYSCRIKEHSNKSPSLAFNQVYMMIKIKLNCRHLDLPTPNPLAFRIGVISQGLVEPPDQEDYSHGSIVPQPSLPLSMETSIILALKVSPKHHETHWPRQSLSKKALLLAGRCRWGSAHS